MKKVLALLAIVGFVACGNGENKDAAADSTLVDSTAVAPAADSTKVDSTAVAPAADSAHK